VDVAPECKSPRSASFNSQPPTVTTTTATAPYLTTRPPLTFHETLDVKTKTALTILLSASAAALAAPVKFTARDVWVPTTTYLTQGADWQTVDTQIVLL
jgi:hypothetical protein